MSRRKIHWNKAPARRELARLDLIAEQGIPTLQPITTTARKLNPAMWGQSFEGDAA